MKRASRPLGLDERRDALGLDPAGPSQIEETARRQSQAIKEGRPRKRPAKAPAGRRFMRLMEKARSVVRRTAGSEKGLLAYGIAWLLGVPLTVLIVIYLIFGR